MTLIKTVLNFSNMKDIDIMKTICQIYEVEKLSILACCMVDFESGSYQERRWAIDVLEGVIDLKKNNYMTVTVTSTAGKRVFEFSNSTPEEIEHYIKGAANKPDFFRGMENSPFFKQI